MVESSLLSKDEPLTSNIDTQLWGSAFLEGGLKIRKSAKFGLLDSGFYFLSKARRGKSVSENLHRSLQDGGHFKITPVEIRSVHTTV